MPPRYSQERIQECSQKLLQAALHLHRFHICPANTLKAFPDLVSPADCLHVAATGPKAGVRPTASSRLEGDGGLCPWGEWGAQLRPQHRLQGECSPSGAWTIRSHLPPPRHHPQSHDTGTLVQSGGPRGSTRHHIRRAFPWAVDTQDVRTLCLENKPSPLEADLQVWT